MSKTDRTPEQLATEASEFIKKAKETGVFDIIQDRILSDGISSKKKDFYEQIEKSLISEIIPTLPFEVPKEVLDGKPAHEKISNLISYSGTQYASLHTKFNETQERLNNSDVHKSKLDEEFSSLKDVNKRLKNELSGFESKMQEALQNQAQEFHIKVMTDKITSVLDGEAEQFDGVSRYVIESMKETVPSKILNTYGTIEVETSTGKELRFYLLDDVSEKILTNEDMEQLTLSDIVRNYIPKEVEEKRLIKEDRTGFGGHKDTGNKNRNIYTKFTTVKEVRDYVRNNLYPQGKMYNETPRGMLIQREETRIIKDWQRANNKNMPMQ